MRSTKRAQRVLALMASATFAWFTTPPASVRADLIDHGFVTTHVSVTDQSGFHVDDKAASSNFNARALVVTSGLSGPGPNQARSEARSSGGSLGVSSIASILAQGGGLTSAYASTSATWDDTVLLVPPGGGNLLGGAVIRFSFYITGYMNVNAGTTPDPIFGLKPGGEARLDFKVNLQSAMTHIRTSLQGGLDVTNQGWTSPFPPLAFTTFSTIFDYDMPLVQAVRPGGATLRYEMDSLASAGVSASSVGDFIDTARLGAINFVTPDGPVTPESLGYSIVFGSGMLSPNLAPVPEPSSLALCGLGLAGVVGYARRRARA